MILYSGHSDEVGNMGLPLRIVSKNDFWIFHAMFVTTVLFSPKAMSAFKWATRAVEWEIAELPHKMTLDSCMILSDGTTQCTFIHTGCRLFRHVFWITSVD